MKPAFLFTLYNRDDIKVFIIIIASIVPFSFSLKSDFVFDDPGAITKNKDITADSFVNVFYSDFWGTSIRSNLSHKSYRPLTTLTFRLNYFLAGQSFNAYYFKITNLMCHTICSILVFYTYRAMFIDAHSFKRQHIYRSFGDVDFLAALLFAVHPIHVEAVSGIVGRADILAAITYFGSFLCYHYSFVNDKLSQNKAWFLLFFSTIFAFISMLFKENGITVLGFCLLYEIIINWDITIFIINSIGHRNKLVKSPDDPELSSLKIFSYILRILVILLTTFISLSIRWMIMGKSVPQFKSIDNPAAFSENLFTKVATYNYLYFINIIVQIWPQWLCFDWSMGCVPLITQIHDARINFIAVLYIYVLLCLRYILNNRKVHLFKKRLLALAGCMLVVPFLPASNIFLTVGFVLAERVLYIPSAGYCLLIAIGVKNITQIKILRKPVTLLYIYLILLYVLRSAQRSSDWQTEYKLFTSGLNVCPLNAKVHYNVAKVADAKNLTQWALAEYKEAIRLYPEYYQAMNNIANLLRSQNKVTEAEEYLKTALTHKNDFPVAWMNLGIVYAGRSVARYKEAEIAYLTAIKYRKNYPDCYYNLGNLYLEMKESDKAVHAWNSAIELKPRHVLAWTNLLALLDNKGRTEEALIKIPIALKVLEDASSIHFIAGNVYGKVGQYQRAEKHFIQCIKLFGDQVQAIHHANFGVLYHRWEKYKLAEDQYRKALKIDPHFKSAMKNLKSLQKLL